jgi:hypothetical protein
MDALVASSSGSEESDNGEQQQEEKQASHEDGGISREIPGFFKPINKNKLIDLAY